LFTDKKKLHKPCSVSIQIIQPSILIKPLGIFFFPLIKSYFSILPIYLVGQCHFACVSFSCLRCLC